MKRPLILKGHERPLTMVKYNSEGDLLFSTAKDSTPTVWWTSNGERIGTYRGHNGAVWAIDVNQDSTRVVTGSADNSAKFWKAENGECIFTWPHKSPVRCVCFSSDGRFVFAATAMLMGQSSEIYQYRVDKESSEEATVPVRTFVGHSATVTRVVCHPSGTTLISTGEDGTVRKWDIETGQNTETVTAHQKSVNDLQLSKSGGQLITASSDFSAKILDFRSLKVLKTFLTDRPVNSAAISPILPHVLLGGGQEASQVTTTGDRAGRFEARLFHLIYEEEIGIIRGHFGPINTVAFSPNGRQFASGAEEGFIRLHNFDEDYFQTNYN
jgi:translation initiation factor 3 subunit I